MALETPARRPHAPPRHLVVGTGPVARRVCAALASEDVQVVHLERPGDAELRAVLDGSVTAVAVVVREDVAALRYALAVAHLDPAVPVVVTIFDRTVGDRLRQLLPQAEVVSPADLAAPSLAGPCLGRDVLAVVPLADRLRAVVRAEEGPVVVDEPPVRRRRLRRVLAAVGPSHRGHDAGTRMLLVGLLGLVAVLLTDLAWLSLGEHRSLPEAFVEAARVVATVGPGTDLHDPAYRVFAGLAMLVTIVLTALFTAGLVDRLVEPRLVGLVGARAVPRSGHVVVIGMGQVGIRLCLELRAAGVAVVGVERDPRAPHLHQARALRIPVVVGHGDDRAVLVRLRLHRSRALAAVGSEELDNVAVAVAASAVAPEVPVVLRAGEQEAIAETRSLLPLGVTRDVTELAASYVVARLRGRPVEAVVAAPTGLLLLDPAGRLAPVPSPDRDDCSHGGPLAVAPA